MMTAHRHLRVAVGVYWLPDTLVPDVPPEVRPSDGLPPRTVWALTDASRRQKRKIAEFSPRKSYSTGF